MIWFLRDLYAAQNKHTEKLDLCISSIDGLVKSGTQDKTATENKISAFEYDTKKQIAGTRGQVEQIGENMLFFNDKTQRQLEQQKALIDSLTKTVHELVVVTTSLEDRCLPKENSEMVQALRKENIALRKKIASMEDNTC